MTEEIELSVEEVTKLRDDFDRAEAYVSWFMQQIKYRQLCSDWLKLRARDVATLEALLCDARPHVPMELRERIDDAIPTLAVTA